MATASYIFFWFLAVILAALAGCVSHYVQANYSAYPDKLLDGEDWHDELLNEALSPNYRADGQYTLEGWWREDSGRNLAIHVVPCVFIAMLGAVYFWEDRQGFMIKVCQTAHHAGIEPRLCAPANQP